MWEEYVGKKILVKYFDNGEDYSDEDPVEFIVLRIVIIHHNTLAQILRINNSIEWIYPSRYNVILSDNMSEVGDAWNQYMGKRLIITQTYDGRRSGMIRECIILRTKDTHAMVYDITNDGRDSMPRTFWLDTRTFQILGEL